MTEIKPPVYLGIDLETTGLDPRKERILEIAAISLDENLEEIACVEMVIGVPNPTLDSLDPFIIEMHTESGLLEMVGGKVCQTVAPVMWSMTNAISRLVAFAKMFPEKPIMLGHSIGAFDRPWLEHHAPEFTALLSHRMVDARTLVQLCPVLEDPDAEKPHRALADIRHSASVCREARNWITRGRTR